MRYMILVLMQLFLFSTLAYAQAPDYRRSPYRNVSQGNAIVAAAGTAVQLSTTSIPAMEIHLSVSPDVVGTIVVGGSGVVAAKAPARQGKVVTGDNNIIYVDNLNKVYIDSTDAGDAVNYAYYW